jgi:Asp-tRNA(Asn)/Glu-tRNA(Gln) amidotransferase A subunit family amidase
MGGPVDFLFDGPTTAIANAKGGKVKMLACDLLPQASGSDLGGSLRIPAGQCCVVGLRPSPGVVTSGDRLPGFSPLPVLGLT